MDTKEQTVRLLLRVLMHSAQLLSYVRDPFLQRSLQDALQESLAAGLRSPGDSGALAVPVAELQRCLEDVSLTSHVPMREMLMAERYVLLLLMHVRSFPAKVPDVPVSASGATTKITPGPDPVPAHGNGVQGNGLTETMRTVFASLGDGKPVRVRDVIARCGRLSERTVRRNLKELVSTGMVLTSFRDGVVMYRTAQAD